MGKEIIGHAPKEVWKETLRWFPIPTVDLVLEYGDEGIIIVRRKEAPLKGKWALPGLRMFKGESFDDTVIRIARDELGLHIDPNEKKLLGVYVARFKTRQDVSTGFCLPVSPVQEIIFNQNHFSGIRITHTIPSNMGAMYKYFLGIYQELKEKK